MNAPLQISPVTVRYIKLGRGGTWERECLERGIARFGYGTERASRFAAVLGRRWGDLTEAFLAERNSRGTATRFTNDARHFFEDGGDALWITFSGQQLWWAFFDPSPPEQHHDGRGTFRRVVDAWRGTDLGGEALTTDRLAGSLTKVVGFRGTICRVGPSAAAYVVGRINGVRLPQIERAVAATEAMQSSARELIALLEPRDFELLVDLVFSSSGWRRLGTVGGTQKTLDLDVQLPSTGERAFIQVKSATTDSELARYVARLDDPGPYRRMFFVYHTGKVTDLEDKRVVVIGPEKLAEMVVDAGLVGWLVAKVS